jgi:hypothetical protein
VSFFFRHRQPLFTLQPADALSLGKETAQTLYVALLRWNNALNPSLADLAFGDIVDGHAFLAWHVDNAVLKPLEASVFDRSDGPA